MPILSYSYLYSWEEMGGVILIIYFGGSWTLGSAFMIEKACAYPLKTPRTRFSTKKDPKMTRLTKYTQGNSNPIASFIWKK